ncbi:hypothetical protein [Pseudonocardia sp. GCM10023141]|uniref:hypothetical protein n=1 Tax=Pseudonocardia sp. GCM10023141 TaxID=3252653 RepID=UPI0036161A0C
MVRSIAVLALGALLAVAVPAAGAATPDVSSCFNGTCTIAVSGPVDIPLDGRAGPTVLSVVGVTSYAVAVSIKGGPNGGSVSMTGVGGRMAFGSDRARITTSVRSIQGGVAVLDISTTVR